MNRGQSNPIGLLVDYADYTLLHLHHPINESWSLCGRPWKPVTDDEIQVRDMDFCPECNSIHTLCIHCGERVYDGGADGWIGEGDDESLYCPRSHRPHGPAMPEYPARAPRWGGGPA